MSSPRRVAILGGGISGLTTAYELTATPALRERFEVTIYESCARLGGKLASGRNARQHLRNEEHGLHVWFGCYHNAFRLAREVLEQWEPPAGSPIRKLEDAFLPVEVTSFLQPAQGRPWHYPHPRYPGDPDLGVKAMSLPMVLERLVDAAAALASTQIEAWGLPGVTLPPRVRGATRRLTSMVWRSVLRLLRLGLARAAGDAAPMSEGQAARLHRLARAARDAAARLPEEHAFAAPLDFLLSALCGALDPRYRLLEDGDLDRLNHLDLREWLRTAGAREQTLSSQHLQMLYDMSFQYRDGDRARPSFEAGTALRIFLRILLGYGGAVLYLLRAGAGETIISPLYELLQARGVRFAFEHQLTGMVLDRRGTQVVHLDFARPLATRASHRTFVHRGLVCWSSDESTGAATRSRRLDAGTDFDDVVLALPAGVVAGRPGEPSPCRALLERSTRLRELFARLNLVPTVSAQLWLDRDRSGLGWDRPPVVLGCGHPLDIDVDMSHVLAFEDWPSATQPRGAHYLCGVLSVPPGEQPLAAARREVAAQLEGGGGAVWPLARTLEGGFDWQVLHAPAGSQGPRRLDEQLVRANVRAGELCDGSAPGTSTFRPEAHDSGLSNLALAGTWIRTGFNTTCVEAAVMAGMAAARAVSGQGREILGQAFLSRAFAAEAPDLPDATEDARAG